jgi:small-conductance mechanosensitive channel
MKLFDKLVLGVFSLLLAGAAAGYLATGRSLRPAAASAAPSGSLIDRRPLQTAQRLASAASSAEEQELAREALRLGDHAVDLSFTIALLEAAEHPPEPTPETRKILDRIRATERLVAEDSARVARLERARATEGGTDPGEVELLKAQLELHRGELADARDDLLRAGGDPQGRIRELVTDHDSSTHTAAAAGKATAADSTSPSAGAGAGGLIGKIERWQDVRGKRELLGDAQAEAIAGVAALTMQRQTFAQHSEDVPDSSAANLLARTRHRTADQKVLAGYNRRIEDQVGLLDVYSRWDGVVVDQQRSALHALLLDLAWLLFILVATVALGAWLERVFVRLSPERRRLHTIRTVARFGVRGLGLLGIALVLVGPPSQLATILGLAGAGLTVVLKDFIVGFFGWFALMGRNGIRLGDWVEINGVSGEVIEMTPFHTVLLETGNWAETGHPTGRQVTFSNAYAIEGHYFNFSTLGQWLWDEVEFVLPSADAAAIIEAIRRIVVAETADNARVAEEEWSRASASRAVREFSADPAIDVRPGSGGVRVLVRYITRAQQRHRVRSRLYQAVMELLGQPAQVALPAPT